MLLWFEVLSRWATHIKRSRSWIKLRLCRSQLLLQLLCAVVLCLPESLLEVHLRLPQSPENLRGQNTDIPKCAIILAQNAEIEVQ